MRIVHALADLQNSLGISILRTEPSVDTHVDTPILDIRNEDKEWERNGKLLKRSIVM